MGNGCLRTACAVGLLSLLTLPASVQAQYNYEVNNGTITIEGFTNMPYSVPASAVIPTTINGLPVTSIGAWAFEGCGSLNNITIPSSVTNIGIYAFTACTGLRAVYFEGNAPTLDELWAGDIETTAFYGCNATVVYLLGTAGWDVTYSGSCPTMEQYGFTITGTNGLTLVAEACTNLVNPIWSSLQTITLTSDNFCFTDPQWTNYSSRFYRLRSP
jgi:hypothetical protein